MKRVSVDLVIDQWAFNDLLEAVGDLADTVDTQVIKGYLDDNIGLYLRPETRKSLSQDPNLLWDVYELLLEVQEQSREQ